MGQNILKKSLSIFINTLLYIIIQFVFGIFYTILYAFTCSILDTPITSCIISLVGFIIINYIYRIIPFPIMNSKKDGKQNLSVIILFFVIITSISILLLINSCEASDTILFGLQQLLPFDCIFPSNEILMNTLYIFLFIFENIAKCFSIYRNPNNKKA